MDCRCNRLGAGLGKLNETEIKVDVFLSLHS